MKKVRKAIFPAAGFGTRFLPVTKALPKEMLPILDKPVIQYLVEEAVASGIEEIIIITGRGKRAIEDHFDHSFELEHNLVEKEKHALLKVVQDIEKLAKFVYVRQAQPLGDGHAILCAKELIGDEPFAILFGDDIVDGKTPALRQLIKLYEKTGDSVIAVEKVSPDLISAYGVIDPSSVRGREIGIKGLVEKPKNPPSNFGIIGKYVCTPDIFEHIEKAKPSIKGEIKLIDGFRSMLAANRKLRALEIEGRRFDTGHKWGLLEANIAFAMKDPELQRKVKDLCERLF
ncbi:UTP--glucose-1-phosphate uridylyltransferase GalU [Candidatus Peregrinibacteria bacterium]|nr:UTP--glucose-1-phosphate uridylyltransferase GalU [Candidatus Peregrinibacteria bacterium]